MKKILVGVSGGVDSSVAAALLLEQGYEVETGIFVMQGVDNEARTSARSIAWSLGVPHHEFDVSNAFDNHVIKYFVHEYQNGRTPNPCIRCNEKIKMDMLLEKAGLLSCDRVATGHYARIEARNHRYILKQGIDKNEQSYFLYRLQQRHLQHLVFPLGDMTRTETETYAREKKLPSARQRKSQDICFVPDNNYPDFLKEYMVFTPGPVIDKNGVTIGEHKGIGAYTIGQRRGLGISAPHPLYVLRINSKNNTITVAEKADLYRSDLLAGDVNFLYFDALQEKMDVYAKPRYVSDVSPATVEPVSRGRIRVVFSMAQWALTPGQSVVFYQDDILIGGGVIQEVR